MILEEAQCMSKHNQCKHLLAISSLNLNTFVEILIENSVHKNHDRFLTDHFSSLVNIPFVVDSYTTYHYSVR